MNSLKRELPQFSLRFEQEGITEEMLKHPRSIRNKISRRAGKNHSAKTPHQFSTIFVLFVSKKKIKRKMAKKMVKKKKQLYLNFSKVSIF